MPSVIPVLEAEKAIWDFLNTKAAYTALGLVEFRSYLGSLLPYEVEKGPRVDPSKLPSIGSIPVDVAVDLAPANRAALSVDIGFQIVHAPTVAVATRNAHETALYTILGILIGSRGINDTRWDSPWIKNWEIKDVRTIPWPGRDIDGTRPDASVRFWESRFVIAIDTQEDNY